MNTAPAKVPEAKKAPENTPVPETEDDIQREKFLSLRNFVVAAAAGLCIAGSVPPWGWWPLAFVGFALVDILIADKSWKQRFVITWLVAAFWLYPAMLWMWALTAPSYIFAGGFYACYFALAAALTPSNTARRIALPGSVVLAELARWSWPFGGVPLANLAISQAGSPFAHAATLGGSLILVPLVVAGGQALNSLRLKDYKHTWSVFALLLVVPLAGAFYPSSKVEGTITIAAVQGGGAQQTRASSNAEPIVLARHLEATKNIDRPVDLVLWPENVVNPGSYLRQDAAFESVASLAEETNAEVMAGWFFPVSDTETVNYQSVINPDGQETDRYDKVRLVPFGEYVPLRSFVERFGVSDLPRRDVRVGRADPVLETSKGPVGVSISWEGFFDNRARSSVLSGAQILTNPTNGASYWLTQVQTQQVASNQLRAIENDRWVVQAAPTGLTAIIDPDGNVVQRTNVSERKSLVAEVEMRSGLTPAARFGRWPVAILGLAATLWGLGPAIREKVSGLKS